MGNYRPALPAAVRMLTTATDLRRPTYLLYPIEPGWPDSSACGGARGALLPQVQLPFMGAAVPLTPPPSPSGWLLPPPFLTVCRPWRRARRGGLPPLALRVPPPAGHCCMPHDRPLAARPARRHRRRRRRGQPGYRATPPLARSPACARRAFWPPRHGRDRPPPSHCLDTSARRRRGGDLWRAAATPHHLQRRQRQRCRRGRAQLFRRAPAQGVGPQRAAARRRRYGDATTIPPGHAPSRHRAALPTAAASAAATAPTTATRCTTDVCCCRPSLAAAPPSPSQSQTRRRRRRCPPLPIPQLMPPPLRPPSVHRGWARRLVGAPPAAPAAGRGGAAPPGPAAGLSRRTRRNSRRPTACLQTHLFPCPALLPPLCGVAGSRHRSGDGGGDGGGTATDAAPPAVRGWRG